MTYCVVWIVVGLEPLEVVEEACRLAPAMRDNPTDAAEDAFAIEEASMETVFGMTPRRDSKADRGVEKTVPCRPRGEPMAAKIRKLPAVMVTGASPVANEA